MRIRGLIIVMALVSATVAAALAGIVPGGLITVLAALGVGGFALYASLFISYEEHWEKRSHDPEEDVRVPSNRLDPEVSGRLQDELDRLDPYRDREPQEALSARSARMRLQELVESTLDCGGLALDARAI